MNYKKILSTLLVTCSLVGTISTVNVLAKENVSDTVKTEVAEINTPKIAGIFTVTAKSGANIRAGAGTNYKIVATARYGAELYYMGEDRYDSKGVLWYKVKSENGKVTGWISSQVGWLG
ncbi:SH3 domain-containing protein [Clostridium perfringens]|uniref:SH3 domain-containing protein n=1 Tax=Clostridium perfringens TaxID=1502 RepID=UPI000D71515D|nr:SH3 domain-containing protein [Clostridium perfringens]PWX70225.1 SH3 domain-containing protein [Clostridium perfringens]